MDDVFFSDKGSFAKNLKGECQEETQGRIHLTETGWNSRDWMSIIIAKTFYLDKDETDEIKIV